LPNQKAGGPTRVYLKNKLKEKHIYVSGSVKNFVNLNL
jgi:hypothetical protein